MEKLTTTRIFEIFHEVADLAPHARDAYFDEHGIDDDARREVEALLRFDTGCSRPLRDDIGLVADNALARFEPQAHLCGAYRVGDCLGSGGMGAVYAGERVDGEVAQRVAIKLLRPGADAQHLRDRFLSERQILARLSHPYIARLLDAGHREDGQPYLVMEHVAGQDIDAYAANLEAREKVTLFLKVCSAVDYLHRNLVVHRDLKPGNILVTGEGEPKLLDFGIAKMLEPATDSTVTSLRMLTPDYASPEQITGGPITTATDIYSLGAVLYKLLTGSVPDRPARPHPLLRGDLEMVLMKALRSQPEERYLSAQAFADDLRAWLDRRPVAARTGDRWYRARRWTRRYWVPAAATLLVIASLATGWYLAEVQRAVAERRFAQLRQLSNRVMDFDRAIRVLPGAVEARQRLVAASLEYLEGLARDVRANPDLAQEISDGYWRMARIQGVPAEFTLGDTTRAEDSLKKADALMESVLAARPRDRNALFRSALIAQDRMILADTDERFDDTRLHARKASARLEELLSASHSGGPARLDGFLPAGDPAQAERSGAANLYVNLAIAHLNLREYEEGGGLARRGWELTESTPSARNIAIQALSVLANAQRFEGDLDSAWQTIRRARELSNRTTYPSQTARVMTLTGVLMREGRILGERNAVNLGRTDEAVADLHEALELDEEMARKDPHEATFRTRLGTVAREFGEILMDRDPGRALAVFDLGIRRLSEVGSLGARRERAELLATSSYPLRRLHRPDEAARRIEAAMAILKETNDYPARRVEFGGHVYAFMCAFADQRAAAGDPAGALAIYEDLLHKIEAGGPAPERRLPDAVNLSTMYAAMADLNRRCERADAAASWHERQLALWRHWDTALPHNAFVRRELRECGAAAGI